MSAGTKERFVFKQSYKSRNEKSTKILNQKHLVYIATRPGVMKNEGCGFGLWGKLPGMKKVDDVEDLRDAKRIVGEASESHTLYRAVLSVDEKTAKEFNLYDRKEWERLINAKIDVVRRAMNIKKGDFCWTAAMHYKKHHPHIHIIYWDNGKEPRREHINKQRFEALSEEVRRALTAALENDPEIRQLQSERADLERNVRLQLNAMLKESNLADALNLDHIRAHTANELGDALSELLSSLPETGRLYYDFVPDDYKAQLDSFVDRVLMMNDFSKLERQYLDYAAEISELYGNADAVIDKRVEDARRKLRKALANETLRYLRDTKLLLSAPKDVDALTAMTEQTVRAIARSLPEYQAALSCLPDVRMPMRTVIKDEDAKRKLDELVKKLADDARIRDASKAYFHKAAKDATTKEERREIGKPINSALYKAVGNTVWNMLREDEGYDVQEKRDAAINCLLRLFRDASQENNRMRASRDLMRERYRNLSETARKNLRKEREQQGSWSPEL